MSDIKNFLQIVTEADRTLGHTDLTAELVTAVKSYKDDKLTAEQFQQHANSIAKKLADKQSISYDSAKQLVDDFVDQYTNLSESQLNEIGFLAAPLGALGRLALGGAVRGAASTTGRSTVAKQVGRGLAVDAATGAVVDALTSGSGNTTAQQSSSSSTARTTSQRVAPAVTSTWPSSSSSGDAIDSSSTLTPSTVTKKAIRKPVKKLSKITMTKPKPSTTSSAVPVKEWGASHPRKPKADRSQMELPFTGNENKQLVYYVYDEKNKEIVADNLPDTESAIAVRDRMKTNNDYLSVRHKFVPIDITKESVDAQQSKKWLVHLDFTDGTKKKIITTANSSDEAEEKTIRWIRKKDMGIVSFAHAEPHLEESNSTVTDEPTQSPENKSVDSDGISAKDLGEILFNRLVARYPDIVSNYGFGVVGDAIADVASFHAGVSELGTSDIGIMMREVLSSLKASSQATESIVQEESMRLNKDNRVMANNDRCVRFARLYIKGNRGDYRSGGPTAVDVRNSERFNSAWDSKKLQSGFGGSGTILYTNRDTGEQFEVNRQASGEGFYGTIHTIREVGASPMQTESRKHSIKYNGYTYASEVDDEGDIRKIWHDAIDADGNRTTIDFNPYDHMDADTFKKWIKLGKPGRQGLGPLNKKQIDAMYDKKHKVDESTGVTDYNPKSQGGTRKELTAKYRKTKNPKDAEAARRAGASQKELQGVTESAGLYGPFTVTINTGERPQSRTKTKKFRREDDAILWAQDWLEDAPQYVFATAEVTDPDGNVVWTTDEQGVAEGFLGDREYNRVMPVVKRIASEVSDYDRDEFGEELWSLLDQKYGSKFAQSVLQDSLDFYWDEYTELTGQQGVPEGRFDGPLTGWHIVSRKSGNPVHATPSFETKDEAQKYLMTKMFANHQDYKVVHTAKVGVAEGVDLDRRKNPKYPNDPATIKHRLATAQAILNDPSSDEDSKKEASAIIARLSARKKDVKESDISGILSAAKLAKNFIVTAEVDGVTKKFRVRGVSGPVAAKERFLKHASNAKILDVKQIDESKIAEGGFFDLDQPNVGDTVRHKFNKAVGKVKKIGTQGNVTTVYFRDNATGNMNFGQWKKHVFPVKVKEVDEAVGRTPPSHTIEAYGIKGMKRTAWRKSFKNYNELNKWCEKFDAEVHGTRELDQNTKNIKEVAGDGYIGPTVKFGKTTVGIPNLVRSAQDASDAMNRKSQQTVDAANAIMPGAKMPNVKYYHDKPSQASQDIFGIQPPTPQPKNESAGDKFTSKMINRLKAEYEKINTIDPDSSSYEKLLALLDKMTVNQLAQVVDAKIKFVSGLARNRLVRKQKQEPVEEDFQSDFLATTNSPGYKQWKLERDIKSGKVPDPNYVFVPPVSEPSGTFQTKPAQPSKDLSKEKYCNNCHVSPTKPPLTSPRPTTPAPTYKK